MRKSICISFIVHISLLLSACSLNQDVADLYKVETPLEVEITLPQSFSDYKQETIKATLSQDGKRITEADFVHFEIWKQDGSLVYGMEEAEEEGNGMYSITKGFDRNGLYYIKVHAGSNGSIIMPQQQFIVGELSGNEMKFLQKGLRKQAESHEHHH